MAYFGDMLPQLGSLSLLLDKKLSKRRDWETLEDSEVFFILSWEWLDS
jgi:hypothetical protein